MSAAAIVPLRMTDATLRRRIAALAEDSAKVLLTRHARQRMRQRRVLMTQVLDVLRRGAVVEPAHRNIRGDWQCTLSKICAGDHIRVVAVLALNEAGEAVVVITVMT